MKIVQSCRLSVGTCIKPSKLAHQDLMLKPTLRLSPVQFLYVDMAVLPYRGQLSVYLQKNFSFGFFQVVLFNKNIPFAQGLSAAEVAATEQMRHQMNLPLRPLKQVDVTYSEGTIFASATLFEKKREIRMFQGVLEDVSPVQPLSSTEFAAPFDGLIFFFVVFAVLFTLRSLSQAYSRTKKKFVFVLCAVGLVGLYFLKRYLYK